MKWEARKRWQLGLTGLWLLLTFSLSAWWMIHGMREGAVSAADATRQQRMFFWEGTFLLSFVTFGGAALSYLVYKDQRSHEEVRRFFSTFTHELKTSLTSLRLQAEILEEDPRNSGNENLRRLLRDVVRLELQLENALILAQSDKGNLFLEDVSLRKTLLSLSAHWPQLNVEIQGDAKLRGDQRAMECIFRNLLQNASVHGEARRVEVSLTEQGDSVRLIVKDDGKGFEGDPSRLGVMFLRHNTRSGSGLGLYLCKLLAGRMHGNLSLRNGSPRGLEVVLEMKGKLA